MKLFLRGRSYEPARQPLVMGILNTTPDSFSDGGAFASAQQAVAHAQRMIAEGADIVDIGPESTRPGAEPVDADRQIARAVPVIEALRAGGCDVPISIDTRSAIVAQAALEAGADVINDVSGLRDDPAMVEAAVRYQAPVILMHMKGNPADMQVGGGPHYDDVIGEILDFFQQQTAFAEHHGVARERILLDPGLGFGKQVEHNLEILRHLHRFASLGRPLVVGASRKRFIGAVLDEADPGRRLAGSVACAVTAVLHGASVIRAHDVAQTVQAVRMASALR